MLRCPVCSVLRPSSTFRDVFGGLWGDGASFLGFIPRAQEPYHLLALVEDPRVFGASGKDPKTQMGLVHSPVVELHVMAAPKSGCGSTKNLFRIKKKII